jgi:glycine dehydrogenase subunit 1
VAYLYTTPAEEREMLSTIGVPSIESLFDGIPAELRLDRLLNLPPALSELELEARMTALARKNVTGRERVCFLGGGAYDHFIPAAVDAVAGRSEYYTAYTPYQAEASQGSLQTFFEFQTMVCELAGLDVANASLYEGGTGLSEAVFMSQRINDRFGKVVVLGSVHPEYRQVLETYLNTSRTELVTVPTPGGVADLDRVAAAIDDTTTCLVFQTPNYFGCLEEGRALVELAHARGALAVVSFDPLSTGVLARPGDYGADIAVAEGQGLGIPLQFGGPFLGLFACRSEFVRKMPGRLIGETLDRNGRKCFSLNLQAREQHIRRDKATSNICTNQGLMAVRATVYLSLLGPQGLRELAELCCQKAHYLADQLVTVPGVQLAYAQPFFKEFALRVEGDVAAKLARLRSAGFDVGPRLAGMTLPGDTAEGAGLLVAVTEKRTRAELDALVAAFRGLV